VLKIASPKEGVALMPVVNDIRISPRLVSYELLEDDRKRVDRRKLLQMLELCYLIRKFESTLLELDTQGLVYGPVHSSIGQEAVAAGCGVALKRSDVIGSTHRAHHHFLGKALPYYTQDTYDPARDPFLSEMQECVFRTLAEIMGLRYGWCGGRGGSMHLRNREAGIIGTSAIVGGGIALTTGAAWAQKLNGTGNRAVAFFGDGALNQGIVLESANMAKLWNIPVIYAIENNSYAVGTSTEESSSTEFLAQRALGFDMDGIVVDGMDPVAVYCVLKDLLQKKEAEAVEKEARGAKPCGVLPCFLELRTYRFFHHKGKTRGSSLGYRTQKEEGDWEKRDPCVRFPEKLKALNLLNEKEEGFIRQKVEESVDEAASKLTVRRGGTLAIPESHWPNRESLNAGLVGKSKDALSTVRFSEMTDFSDYVNLTFVNIISQVAARNMEKDSSVVLLGEEVGKFGAGAYGATRFVVQKFPERTYNTPISEAGFLGIAFGASLCGIKPIVEIMFPDFALVAADQLFNQIGKLGYLFGGRVEVPLIVRTRIATGQGFGAQHSSDPSGLFALFSGWRILAPSTPFDYVGLFNSALISAQPVLILEHHALYKEKGPVPRGNLDYFIRLGKGRVVREGRDATVLTYLNGMRMMGQIAAELDGMGISAEVIDLRSLDYHSIDYEIIERSLRKTGRVIVLEEASKSMGIGARVADEVQERYFPLLKAPVSHINSLDVPLPVSRKLEEEVLVNSEKVKIAIQRWLNTR
jgi:2-oxoisovalerate dehydrogenase E1 component